MVRPLPTFKVPVKFADDEIVCPLINPEVIAPTLIGPAVKPDAVSEPIEALFEKRLVVVALVPVAFTKLKF